MATASATTTAVPIWAAPLPVPLARPVRITVAMFGHTATATATMDVVMRTSPPRA
jgi:hypothetical protein